VIPITADQDTPGPMARTVTDAAILFGVLEGEPDGHDSRDARVHGSSQSRLHAVSAA
jgi:amidase